MACVLLKASDWLASDGTLSSSGARQVYEPAIQPSRGGREWWEVNAYVADKPWDRHEVLAEICAAVRAGLFETSCTLLEWSDHHLVAEWSGSPPGTRRPYHGIIQVRAALEDEIEIGVTHGWPRQVIAYTSRDRAWNPETWRLNQDVFLEARWQFIRLPQAETSRLVVPGLPSSPSPW